MAQDNIAGDSDSSAGFKNLVYIGQFFFGGWFLVHGLNHWFHFFPQPPGSSPAGAGLIAALIDSGMFDLVKALEVVAGAMMLANRWVPLSVIIAFPIGIAIAVFDHTTNGDWYGTGAAIIILLLLTLMAIAHLERFLPLLVFNQGEPSLKGVKQIFNPKQGEGKMMRPISHIVAIILGIAAPTALTFWSVTDSGPRSRAHYERAAAMDVSARAIVERFTKQAIDEHQPMEAVAEYFSADVVEHGHDEGSAAARLEARGWALHEQQRKTLNVVVEKDLAVVQQLVFSEEGGPPHAEIDIFRVDDGKIVEHWELVQD